jgi:hypothetical protein
MDTQEGTTSLANGGYRPDAATGADQASLAWLSLRAREAPVAALQYARRRLGHPQPEPHLRPPEVVQPRPGLARLDPDGARRAQI